MKILAIESSAVTASVAILAEDVLTAEYTINYKKTHSQTLLPMIEEICKMTETVPETLDLIAVSAGPGSFTGLRIGAATGKGLALALNKKMVAVPTLEAMAYNVYGVQKHICPVMDARRQHLYTGVYHFNKDGELSEDLPQSLLSYEELTDYLNTLNSPVIFVGDGAVCARETFSERLACSYEIAPAPLCTQRAGSVALLAEKMYARGEWIEAAQLKPDYLRPSQAERELAEKDGQ